MRRERPVRRERPRSVASRSARMVDLEPQLNDSEGNVLRKDQLVRDETVECCALPG